MAPNFQGWFEDTETIETRNAAGESITLVLHQPNAQHSMQLATSEIDTWEVLAQCVKHQGEQYATAEEWKQAPAPLYQEALRKLRMFMGQGDEAKKNSSSSQ